MGTDSYGCPSFPLLCHHAMAVIRACRVPIKHKAKQNDIECILYSRGQEEMYDSDTLYAVFSELEPQRVADILQRISTETPEGVPAEVVELLISYYAANKPEDSDWVVLSVTNVDAYFGSTNFNRKWWNKVPESIIVKQKQSFGVCRYMITKEFIQ